MATKMELNSDNTRWMEKTPHIYGNNAWMTLPIITKTRRHHGNPHRVLPSTIKTKIVQHAVTSD